MFRLIDCSESQLKVIIKILDYGNINGKRKKKSNSSSTILGSIRYKALIIANSFCKFIFSCKKNITK